MSAAVSAFGDRLCALAQSNTQPGALYVISTDARTRNDSDNGSDSDARTPPPTFVPMDRIHPPAFRNRLEADFAKDGDKYAYLVFVRNDGLHVGKVPRQG